jgi:hypothetical protein
MIVKLLGAGLTVGGVMTAIKLHREDFMSCRDAEAFVQFLLRKAAKIKTVR